MIITAIIVIVLMCAVLAYFSDRGPGAKGPR